MCCKCNHGVQEHVILTEIWPKYELFCNIQIKNIYKAQPAVVLSWFQICSDHMLKNLPVSFLTFVAAFMNLKYVKLCVQTSDSKVSKPLVVNHWDFFFLVKISWYYWPSISFAFSAILCLIWGYIKWSLGATLLVQSFVVTPCGAEGLCRARDQETQDFPLQSISTPALRAVSLALNCKYLLKKAKYFKFKMKMLSVQ